MRFFIAMQVNMITASRVIFLVCFINFVQGNEFDRLLKVINDNVDNGKKWRYPEKNSDFSEDVNGPSTDFGSYDFVIVGAGSGGATLARRLSEYPKWKILLLEAGGNETEYSKLPAAFTNIQASDINWGYRTTPQKHVCQSAINKQCSFPRGKVLGGSSSINAMLYVRGVEHDFQKWVKLGNPGWSFDKVLCYFKKSEEAHFRGDYNYTGYNGPLHINLNKPIPQILRNVLRGFKELGYPTIRDYNGRRSIGISLFQNNVMNGKRNSANEAYLNPVLRRKNLNVLTRALATKIIINRDKSVKELQFLYQNKSYSVKPKIELLVAGGSINTPQLLMLSGIGPRKHLESLNISVVVDLPVGKNLADHASSFSFMIQTNASSREYSLRQQVEQYFKGYGPITWGGALVVGFLQTNKLAPRNYPNIENGFLVPNLNFPDLSLQAGNYEDTIKPYFASLKPNTIITNIGLLHSKSRGEITLKSVKPTDFPFINLNQLSDPDDIETLYKGINMTLDVLNTPAMKRINATLQENTIPECKGLNGKESILCQMKHLTIGGHPVGTCRMGKDAENSVVNTNLQVHGIRKLRVVDASIFPIINSGHIHAVVVMIAEKIADELKQLYLQRKPSC